MKKMLVVICLVLGACDSKPVPTTSPLPPSPSPAAGTTGNDPKAAADPDIAVRGTVTFAGTPPKRTKVKPEADQECAKQYTDENPLLSEDIIVGSTGGLKNVIVRVKKGLEGRSYPVPTTPQTVGQKGCHYEPHVFGIIAGQGVRVVNDDQTNHNVKLLPATNPGDNKSQVPGQENTFKLGIPEEPFFIKCDIHPWMGAWCLVSAHPYFAVTGEDGAYMIANLPPGEYVIEAWHEKLGKQEKTVKLAAKGKETWDVRFEKK